MRTDEAILASNRRCVIAIGDAMSLPNCPNCGAALTGPYCAACGQHAHDSARTVGVLFHDALHVLTHADNRFWRTLYTLLLRPGRLTQEYFAERRARYLPPVRVYLILSLLFFALVPFGPHSASKTAPVASNEAASSVEGKSARALDKAAAFNVEFSDCDRIESSFKWLESSLRQACRRNVGSGGAPVQAAFIAHDGLQCGFCTPGQIMSAIGLIQEGQAGDDPERIREGMSGNLCRCGAYCGIADAVLDAQNSLAEANQGRAA